ncbi:MAG: imidazolonepropionase [Alphaproteobacteria bacterium]
MAAWDRLIVDCRLATMCANGAAYGAIEDGAVLINDGRIAFSGARRDLPADAESSAKHVDRLDGRWVTPGLIDCHTHIVFAGDRVAEWEARLKGESYEEIARRGGGIATTVRATRKASEGELLELAGNRLAQMLREGLTTIEIKSGYGLDRETEFRMLSAARELGRRFGVRASTTYLGLHALPAEYAHDRAAYVRLVCDEVLPELTRAGLVDAVDAFVEPIAFSAQEAAAFFSAAKRLGIPVKLHADQRSNGNGAALAAEFGALSADHIEHTDEGGVAALAKAGSVAVLLPGAFLFLRDTQRPPIELLRRHGVPMAVATDCNPGSSPLVSPLAAMHLACALFGLAPEEALAGMTRNAARALGLANSVGTLEAGKHADLAVWAVERPSELAYWLGNPLCHASYVGGAPLAWSGSGMKSEVKT